MALASVPREASARKDLPPTMAPAPVERLDRETETAKMAAGMHTCREHPRGELSYFCEDCCSGPLCSDCVVHGIHKTHRVQNIESAYSLARQRLELRITEYNGKIQTVAGVEEQLNSLHDKIMATARNMKAQIESGVADVEQMLAKARDSISQSLDRLAVSDLASLEAQQRIMGEKKCTFEAYRDRLQAQIEDPDHVGFLDQYAARLQYPEPAVEIPHAEDMLCAGALDSQASALAALLERLKRIANEITEVPVVGAGTVAGGFPKSPRGLAKTEPKRDIATSFESSRVFDTFGFQSSAKRPGLLGFSTEAWGLHNARCR